MRGLVGTVTTRTCNLRGEDYTRDKLQNLIHPGLHKDTSDGWDCFASDVILMSCNIACGGNLSSWR